MGVDDTYNQCVEHARQIALLNSVESALGWDERTMMPQAGAEYRAEQMTLLAGMIHQRWVDAKFGADLDELRESAALGKTADNSVDAARQATVRELVRQRDRRVKLPQSLVEERTRLSVLGQHAWFEARQKNEFPILEPLLTRTVEIKRAEADALGYADCRYDALLDEYEPGARTADVRQVFAKLREALVPFVERIVSTGRHPDRTIFARPYAVAQQEAFARAASERIGFEYTRGRLDTTAHPFCTNLGPHDCRITTRYDSEDLANSFFGTLHEAGHGIYEQGLPADQFGLPLGEAVSLGIHESQSRLWENLVGRSRSFWDYFYPQAQAMFPDSLGSVDVDEFYFAANDVRPSLIRTEADEATYNLHVFVRFELEQSLVDDEVRVRDLPEAWRERYQNYLGIVPPDDTQGVLQDIHWSAGLFGYFPTYALGNLYASQFFAQADRDLNGLAAMFCQGQFAPLREWLRQNIHQHGQRYPAHELARRVTGRPLDHAALIAHLNAKLGPLYGL